MAGFMAGFYYFCISNYKIFIKKIKIFINNCPYFDSVINLI